MYVNYYDREIKTNDENPTVGILLSTDRNKTVVKNTLPKKLIIYIENMVKKW